MGTGWDSEQPGGLRERIEVGAREQDGISTLGGDFDRLAILSDLLDRRQPLPAGLPGGNGQSGLLDQWRVLPPIAPRARANSTGSPYSWSYVDMLPHLFSPHNPVMLRAAGFEQTRLAGTACISPLTGEIPSSRLRCPEIRGVRRDAMYAQSPVAMSVVTQASSKLGNQFLVTALIPTAIFLPITLGIVVQALWGLSAVMRLMSSLSPLVQVLAATAALAAIWLVASLALGQATLIVQIFEGGPLKQFWAYWLWSEGDKGPRVPGVASHLRRRHALQADARSHPEDPSLEFKYDLSYDTQDIDVLPTSLGNILNAAEKYPEHRYGVDSVVFWSRLAMVVPENILTEIDTLITQYQLPLMIAAWGMALAVCSLAAAWAGHPFLFSGSLWGGVLACLLGYRMSLRSAQDYGMALRSTYDMYRDCLVEKWPSLDDIPDERARFRQLHEFIVGGRIVTPRIARPAKDGSLWDSESRLDKEGSSPADKPGWRPPLSLSLVIVWLCLWVAGLGLIYCRQATYLVSRANVRAYSTFTVTFVHRSYDRRLPSPQLPITLAGLHLIAIRTVKAGAILTVADAVKMQFEPEHIVPVRASAAETQQLNLVPGATATLAFSGSADFASDPVCRMSYAAGATRTVEGEVLSVNTVSPSERAILVALGPTSNATIACYGAESASLLARGP